MENYYDIKASPPTPLQKERGAKSVVVVEPGSLMSFPFSVFEKNAPLLMTPALKFRSLKQSLRRSSG